MGRDTLCFNGAGKGFHSRGRSLNESAPAFRKTFNYQKADFKKLINKFFQARFLQLDDDYQNEAWMVFDSDGASIMIGGIADAGSSELILELGSYRKVIRYIASPTYCPAYLLELEKEVDAFARLLENFAAP